MYVCMFVYMYVASINISQYLSPFLEIDLIRCASVSFSPQGCYKINPSALFDFGVAHVWTNHDRSTWYILIAVWQEISVHRRYSGGKTQQYTCNRHSFLQHIVGVLAPSVISTGTCTCRLGGKLFCKNSE